MRRRRVPPSTKDRMPALWRKFRAQQKSPLTEVRTLYHIRTLAVKGFLQFSGHYTDNFSRKRGISFVGIDKCELFSEDILLHLVVVGGVEHRNALVSAKDIVIN